GVGMTIQWLTGGERSVAIQAAGPPLFPLRADWLRQSAMQTTAAVGTLAVASFVGLPVIPSTISAAIIAVSPDRPAMRRKGRQRALGVVVGGGYAFACLMLLHYLQQFALLLALSFAGAFVAGYYTKASKNYSYVALQAGLVIPMVLLGTANEVGTIA